MIHKEHGFTLIEIVVVMVLVSIIAATVFTRSITTEEINLRSRAEKVQNYIRYAQSMALKTNDVWGINSFGPEVWLFNGYQPSDVATPETLPGEEPGKITWSESDIRVDPFLLYFDQIGKPYKGYTNPDATVPVTTSNPLTIEIKSEEDLSIVRKLSITPETGLIVVTQ